MSETAGSAGTVNSLNTWESSTIDEFCYIYQVTTLDIRKLCSCINKPNLIDIKTIDANTEDIKNNCERLSN